MNDHPQETSKDALYKAWIDKAFTDLGAIEPAPITRLAVISIFMASASFALLTRADRLSPLRITELIRELSARLIETATSFAAEVEKAK